MLTLNNLKSPGATKNRKRIGRGQGSGWGTQAGKGDKGQKARAGNSTRPEMREQIKKLPKLRGHGINRAKTVNADKVAPFVINVSALNGLQAGSEVTPKTLVAAGIVATRRKKAPAVKILGNGDLSVKLTVSGCAVSKTAVEKIEAAGGSVAV